jgi:hypothetical protein
LHFSKSQTTTTSKNSYCLGATTRLAALLDMAQLDRGSGVVSTKHPNRALSGYRRKAEKAVIDFRSSAHAMFSSRGPLTS